MLPITMNVPACLHAHSEKASFKVALHAKTYLYRPSSDLDVSIHFDHINKQ
jgi:hypothetical protein